MKNRILFFLLLTYLHSFSQNRFEVINVASREIAVLKENKNKTLENKNKSIVKNIYTPYKNLWEGYIGSEIDFLNWINNKAYSKLSLWEDNKVINSKVLTNALYKHQKKMYSFTGYEPQGKWYIIFGPSHTDLGGLGSGEMIVDLANENNSSNKKIIKLYAHELNHQIYFNTKPETPNIALNRIIDEGFASYVSYLFHNKEFSKASELGYTVEEYNYCVENETKLILLLKKYYLDENESISRSLANRNYKISDRFPGAIGYYIGFRIIEEYVKKNGANSWKDIYTMKPLDVLKKSEILENLIVDGFDGTRKEAEKAVVKSID